jgi:hypothetical protein
VQKQIKQNIVYNLLLDNEQPAKILTDFLFTYFNKSLA